MNIIERKDAKNAGFYRFFTGRPCKNGHVAYRYTTSGSCSKCISDNRKLVGFSRGVFEGPDSHVEILRQVWRGLGHSIETPTLAPRNSGPLVLPPAIQASRDSAARAVESERLMQQRREQDADTERQLQAAGVAATRARLLSDADRGDGSAPSDEFGPAWCR